MLKHRNTDICECGAEYGDHSIMGDRCPASREGTLWFHVDKTFIEAEETMPHTTTKIELDHNRLIVLLNAVSQTIAVLSVIVALKGSAEEMRALADLENAYRAITVDG